jgi:hypothetical protein
MTAICLIVAGVVGATLPTDQFTLSWRHSVEKTLWEETYHIDGDHLLLTKARIQGNGAGMEAPEGAVLHDGTWTWTPPPHPLAALALTQSTYTSDWTICWNDRCSTLGRLVPPTHDGDVVRVVACEAGRDKGVPP